MSNIDSWRVVLELWRKTFHGTNKSIDQLAEEIPIVNRNGIPSGFRLYNILEGRTIICPWEVRSTLKYFARNELRECFDITLEYFSSFSIEILTNRSKDDLVGSILKVSVKLGDMLREFDQARQDGILSPKEVLEILKKITELERQIFIVRQQLCENENKKI